MLRPTYRLTLAYDGAAFAGYARQPGARTVEGELREALAAFEPRAWAVGGRTDRGVSAQAQVISLRLPRPAPAEALQDAIDARAPGALACLEVREVERRFHAAFSARARRYAYLAPAAPDLDIPRLQALLTGLVGRRCFSAYARDTRPGQGTVRTLWEARVESRHEGERPVLAFHFFADAFLRKQVRVMVATALREARAGAPPERLAELAARGDRAATAWPAAPEPLRLVRIVY